MSFSFCASSPFKVCQPLDCIVICRVKSGQTAVQLSLRAWVNHVRHCLGFGYMSTVLLSLSDFAVAFDRRRSGPPAQYGTWFSSVNNMTHRSSGRLGLGHKITIDPIVSVRRHLLLQAPQWPCTVWNMIQQRPLLSRKGEDRLSDCEVSH